MFSLREVKLKVVFPYPLGYMANKYLEGISSYIIFYFNTTDAQGTLYDLNTERGLT